jgi:DNA-binding transcriptional ArsR family regulator
MPEDIVVLKPGDDRAHLIAKTLASKTANEILTVLKDGEYSSSEIAERLSIPITTASYHIDNLTKAEIIEVVRTRWSPKGREVKIYGVRDQLVIVAPGKTDIRALILKYASLFAILILATIIVAILWPISAHLPIAEAPSFDNAESFKAGEPTGVGSADEGLLRTGQSPEAIAEHALLLAFFGGGCVVLLVMILLEILHWYRERRMAEEQNSSL